MVRTSLLAMIVCVSTMQLALGQHKPRAESLAKSYNTNVQKIYDDIGTIGKQLSNDSLSMSEASKIIDQQSALRKKADALWNSTQGDIDASYKTTRDEIITFNDNAKRLDYESAVVGSKIDLLNNVGKNSTRESFDQSKSQMSADWDKKYGSRLKPFGEEFAKQKEDFSSGTRTTTAST